MSEGAEDASEASTSDTPIPDSDLFHIPEQLQKPGLPTEGFVYVYDLPSRSDSFTLSNPGVVYSLRWDFEFCPCLAGYILVKGCEGSLPQGLRDASIWES